MSLMTLNVNSACDATIKKQLFELKAPKKDGLLLTLNHTIPTKANAQTIRFLQASFNNLGQMLLAANQRGDIFIVNFKTKKYWNVQNINCCSVLKFSPITDSQILVGIFSGVIYILNADSGDAVAMLSGHRYPVTDFSFSSDNLCISASNCEGIIWNLVNNEKIQVLKLTEGTILKQVMFMPGSNNVLACFQDDIINVWKYGTYEHFKQILPATWNKISIKSIAFTKNGKAMVIGGYSPNIIVFIIDLWEVVRTITLPDHIQGIKKLDFIAQPFDEGANRFLTILTSNGAIYFYNMDANEVCGRISMDLEVCRFSIGADSKNLACVQTCGNVLIYNINQYIDNTPSNTNISDKGKTQSSISMKQQKRNSSASFGFKRNSSSLLTIKKELTDVLDIGKLKGILKEFYEYPETYRQRIWTSLLNLPIDRQQYLTVIQNVYPSMFDEVEKDYPLENKKLLRNLKKLLSNIVSWCPFFADVTFLPIFAFPFVRIFENDPVACFEAVSTIIVNWCQHWFEYYPVPPINVLAMIENIILEQDPALLSHLNTHQITAQMYAWPLLESAFSEILSSEYWLALWDHILTNEPSFILLAVVAYTLMNKSTLMLLVRKDQFTNFYHTQNPIEFKKYVKKIYSLLDSVSECNHPRQYLNYFQKIDGTYPRFVDFPKASLEYRKRAQGYQEENLSILRQEQELIKQGFVELDKFRNLQKTSEEILRVQEMEKIYKEKLDVERNHTQEQQQQLCQLRHRLEYEEHSILQYAERSILHKTCWEKQQALKVLMQNMDARKCAAVDCACHAKKELLKHYETLLRHKMQIEQLIRPKEPGAADDDLEIQQRKLVEEVKKVKKRAKSTKHMKQLNIATGIAAMDILIKKVEAELNKEESHDDVSRSTCYKSHIKKLLWESKQLEEEVRKLLQLLGKS